MVLVGLSNMLFSNSCPLHTFSLISWPSCLQWFSVYRCWKLWNLMMSFMEVGLKIVILLWIQQMSFNWGRFEKCKILSILHCILKDVDFEKFSQIEIKQKLIDSQTTQSRSARKQRTVIWEFKTGWCDFSSEQARTDWPYLTPIWLQYVYSEVNSREMCI